MYKGNTSVSEGERFIITCNLTLFDPVKWEKDGVALVPDLKNKYVFEEENEHGGGILARLVVESALPLHSGTYRCNPFHNESHLLTVSGKSVVNGLVCQINPQFSSFIFLIPLNPVSVIKHSVQCDCNNLCPTASSCLLLPE